jgi:hypothetical protein
MLTCPSPSLDPDSPLPKTPQRAILRPQPLGIRGMSV